MGPAAVQPHERRRVQGSGYVPNDADADADAAARAARAKLDQLKDLYLTAEAIGEDALVRHFDEVSQRQRDLIRDYYRQQGLRPSAVPPPPDESPAQDGPAYQAESATHST